MTNVKNDNVKLVLGVLVVGLVLYLVVSMLNRKRKPQPTPPSQLEVDVNVDGDVQVSEEELDVEGNLGVSVDISPELMGEFQQLVNTVSNFNIPVNDYANLRNQFSPEEIVENFVNVREGFENHEEVDPNNNQAPNEAPVENQDAANGLPNNCYPKEVLGPQDLLPNDTDSTWAQANPSGPGGVSDKNFLNAGFHIGVNTVGQSLRNANRQLRSEPPNPQVKVSPWMQSTIDPDVNRKPLEIA